MSQTQKRLDLILEDDEPADENSSISTIKIDHQNLTLLGENDDTEEQFERKEIEEKEIAKDSKKYVITQIVIHKEGEPEKDNDPDLSLIVHPGDDDKQNEQFEDIHQEDYFVHIEKVSNSPEEAVIVNPEDIITEEKRSKVRSVGKPTLDSLVRRSREIQGALE
jgi:hypothetical protein